MGGVEASLLADAISVRPNSGSSAYLATDATFLVKLPSFLEAMSSLYGGGSP